MIFFRTLDAKNEKMASEWVKGNYPDFVKLATHFVSPSYLNDIGSAIETSLNKVRDQIL